MTSPRTSQRNRHDCARTIVTSSVYECTVAVADVFYIFNSTVVDWTCYDFFFSSKCSLFHNAKLFGSCIIHILSTGCAEIKKKNNSGAKELNTGIAVVYEGLPRMSEKLLVITWILTLSPNFHRCLRNIRLGLIYNDPSDFAVFGSTHWSLPALSCLVPVANLLGSLQWIWRAAISTGVSF